MARGLAGDGARDGRSFGRAMEGLALSQASLRRLSFGVGYLSVGARSSQCRAQARALSD